MERERVKSGSTGVELAGHRVHQMLVVFPLGLLGGAAVFDIVHLLNGREPTWGVISFWLIAAGVIAGLLAAAFGLIDWGGVPKNTRAKRIGALHGVGNVIVVALFALSWWLRRDAPGAPGGFALVLSFVGVSLAVVTGWLGGELVNRLGIGVYDDANPDAPSSLRRRPRPRAADAVAPGRA